jgi:predicted DNA-binding transcriptional regulator AlpA
MTAAKGDADDGVRRLWVPDSVVAAMLGVHRSTIWRWLDQKLNPMPHRVGRRTLWSLEEVELFARCSSMAEFRRLRLHSPAKQIL